MRSAIAVCRTARKKITQVPFPKGAWGWPEMGYNIFDWKVTQTGRIERLLNLENLVHTQDIRVSGTSLYDWNALSLGGLALGGEIRSEESMEWASLPGCPYIWGSGCECFI